MEFLKNMFGEPKLNGSQFGIANPWLWSCAVDRLLVFS